MKKQSEQLEPTNNPSHPAANQKNNNTSPICYKNISNWFPKETNYYNNYTKENKENKKEVVIDRRTKDKHNNTGKCPFGCYTCGILGNLVLSRYQIPVILFENDSSIFNPLWERCVGI